MPEVLDYHTPTSIPRWGAADITLLVLFGLGLAGWFLTLSAMAIAASMLSGPRYSHALYSDETFFMTGISISVVSIALLLPALLCSLRAKRLSIVWRIVALLPSGTGLLAGIVFLFRAFFS